MGSKSMARIYNKLNEVVRARRLSVTVAEVCRKAKVSCTTFYTHFESCEDARDIHEQALETEIMKLLPRRLHEREIVFTILLSFIKKHKQYFTANFRAGNTYLIRHIMRRLKRIFASANLDKPAYEIYIGVIISILAYWVEREHCDATTIEHYAKQLVRIPIYRFEFK